MSKRNPPRQAPTAKPEPTSTIPLAQPPDLDGRKVIYNAPVASITRAYRLATPLFGGGVSTSENDLSMLIRATSIRGQLRFWWRACCGGSANPDHEVCLKDMYEREAALWGSAAIKKDGKQSGNPSRVQVSVSVTNPGSVFKVTNNRGMDVRVSAMNSPYGYAAFPLQDKLNATVREGVEFTLNLTYPEQLGRDDQRRISAELEATLWAWETFGGIGSRTRRGFGVLQRADNRSDYPFKTGTELGEIIKTLIGDRIHWPQQVPHLSGDMQICLIKPERNPLQTWEKLLKRYKDFRQQRNAGREPNRPGRSRWPEPDALRRLAGRRSRQHQEDVTTVDAYPRAAFGLPIIFHFKDSDDPNATLKPANHDRFASPLILKPVVVGSASYGLVAVLAGTSLKDVSVIAEFAPRRQSDPLKTELSAQESQRLTRKDSRTPLLRTPTGPTTDVFAAFLAEFTKEDYA